VKKFERGDLPKSEWLDKLAFRKMEEIHSLETAKSENLFLYIDLPRFDFPVIFSEPASSIFAPLQECIGSCSYYLQEVTAVRGSSPSPLHAVTNVSQGGDRGTLTSSASWADAQFWQVLDPDTARENPVEDKHRRLVRSHRSSPYDRELKPNSKDRDELSVRRAIYAT
jgi:phosphatidylinositol 3-kinase